MSNSHRRIDPLTAGDDVLLEAEDERQEDRYKVYCAAHTGHKNVEVLDFDGELGHCPEARSNVSAVVSKTTPHDVLVMHGAHFKQRDSR